MIQVLDKIDKIWKKFIKETKRSGGILCHSSIHEWHAYLAEHLEGKKDVKEDFEELK